MKIQDTLLHPDELKTEFLQSFSGKTLKMRTDKLLELSERITSVVWLENAEKIEPQSVRTKAELLETLKGVDRRRSR